MKLYIPKPLGKIAKQPMIAVFMALIVSMSNVGITPSYSAINVNPVGSGFTITAADLAFILKQIKIAENHAANYTPDNICGGLVGNGPNQVPSPLLSFGLRTVDGSCNNLQSGQETYGAASKVFPRLTTPEFKAAENSNVPGIGPVGPPGQTSYNQTNGVVVDSHPRTISNLIADQTSSNPAAVWVAAHPPRAQANPDTVVPCSVEPTSPGAGDGQPEGCTPAHEALFIPNITTDVGLSPPFNSLFTIFGQFFDHGLDKITNGGNGAVFVPLKADDPLIAGPDHILVDDPATPTDEAADNLPQDKRFMMLTRGKIVNDPVTGVRTSVNTDTPLVDQSQTYSSHSSHQVFLRDYKLVSGKPVVTGKFLSTVDGGIAKWSQIKEQAATKLGLQLVDVDVQNIPMVAADPYGNFIPGPNGFPQFVTTSGILVEGNPLSPVTAPADVKRIDIAFLNDIAHSADPGKIGATKPEDTDAVAGGSLDTPVPAGSYDNELLDLHYICGDGRCNENIGLTAIHQVFHLEHDRLVDSFYHDDGSIISGVLAQNPQLLADYQNVNLNPANPADKTFTFEERLFQAARFCTEMEYQHLVFEEFARKVQPLINPFEAFAFGQTDLNPAISAEFAHAVYRFGHSMLNETLPRINRDGTHNDIGLLEGFLNPVAFNDGGSAGTLSDRHATASLIMGLSDQAGNEIDEFVTETLRNNLLGLPLDLPSINMARARSEGIPSLNNFRKQIFAATNDGQMAPYASWIAFNEELKHPWVQGLNPLNNSLVNFIAAYGKHPTILAANTLADKRLAAVNILNGSTSDGAEFLYSIGAWANNGAISITGVDEIDLWMGGLAEKTNVFGGLLGSTFNYVFEKQLTALQNGDRFYYLARTPGMNLRSQLEGNSFAEIVLRNTDSATHTLKADAFATADCKFELGNLTSPADHSNPANTIFGAGSVNDDPTTECNENKLLIRLPGKTAAGIFQYRAVNLEDPEGINGQAVYNGTDLADEFFGGNDNDTFWGGLGNDIIEGGGGDDVTLGGEGDDIITDKAGFDFIKGGPGNDAIDGGIGDDIIIAGPGKDFTNGGANLNETFGGSGDDFSIAGQGTDAVFGDSGDDWMEGGDQPDLLIGDSSTFFFNDHNEPGHDILIGQGGDDDYDMEGGDDIGVAGPGVEKNAGGAGFDWLIGVGDPQPQDADLELKLANTLPAFETRDRYNEVEALSGWKFNDTIRGDNVIPSQVTGGGDIGCDALDADGVGRISGLEAIVPASIRTVDPAPIAAATDSNYCGLTAEAGFAGAGTPGGVWGEGNILLGGEGSDTIEGRGANDIIDGDRYMNVRLSVREGLDLNGEALGEEIGSTNLMENAVVSGNFGPDTTGMTLQQAVFAGKVNPGQIVAVREILTPTVPPADCGTTNLNCDTAVFSGSFALSEYTFIKNDDASITVIDNGPAAGAPVRSNDGSDTLRNIEQLSFCEVQDAVARACAVDGRVTVSVDDLVFSNPLPTAAITGSRDFGNVVLGTSSVQIVTLNNTGSANLVVSGMSVTGVDVAAFSFSPATCGTIAIGGECEITVTFTPTTLGGNTATLVIDHNANPGNSTVDLSGIGIGAAPVAAVSATSVAFAPVVAGGTIPAPSAITVSNNGNADLVVAGVTVTGVNAAAFSASIGTCGTVAPNGTCSVFVSFLPTSTGTSTATLVIAHNAAGSATNIPVTGTVNSAGTGTGGTSGTGNGGSVSTVPGTGGAGNGGGTVTVPGAGVPVAIPPVKAAKLPMQTSLDFGRVKASKGRTLSVTVTNHKRVELPIYFVNTSGSAFTATRGNCSLYLGVGKSCKLSVTFQPTVAGKSYSGKLSMVINGKTMITELTGTGRR